jgi:hypothetical protein
MKKKRAASLQPRDWIGTEGRNRTDTGSPPPDFEDDRGHSKLFPINYLHRLPLCHSQSQSSVNQSQPVSPWHNFSTSV